jgi:hypothetical protein
MRETESIAERTIYALDKNGHGLQMQLMIGSPYNEGPEGMGLPRRLDWSSRCVFPICTGLILVQALMQARNLLKNFLSIL